VVDPKPERDTLVIEQGFSVKLICSIAGSPKPTVIWYKDKAPVDVESDNRIQITPDHNDPNCEYYLLTCQTF